MAVNTYRLKIEITDSRGDKINGSTFNHLYAGRAVHFDSTSGTSGNVVSVTLTDQDIIQLQGAVHRPTFPAGGNWQVKFTSGLKTKTIILNPNAASQTFGVSLTLNGGIPTTGGSGGAHTGPTHGMIVSGTHRMIHKFNMNGKVLTHIRYGGKTLTLIDPVYGTKPPTGSPLDYINWQIIDLTALRSLQLHDLAIQGTHAFFISNDLSAFWQADYNPTTGTFSNFRHLDLSAHLTSTNSNWSGLTIEGTHAYFINSHSADSFTATYNPIVGTFSNFKPFDLSGKLTRVIGGGHLRIFGTHAYFLNSVNDSWTKADYNPATGTFSNFRKLDLSAGLTSYSSFWGDLSIQGTHAFFLNGERDKGFGADYDPVTGNFSNFKPIDLSTKLLKAITNNALVLHGKYAYFINSDFRYCMRAELAGATTDRNSFSGTFVDWKGITAAQYEAEFNAITTSVADAQFNVQTKLTSISLSEVTSIGNYAFQLAHLTSINIPKADTIGKWAFYHVVNAPTTHVTMKAKFNNKADKDRIFTNGWDQITFTWV